MYELAFSLLLILLVIGVFFNCFLPLAILYLSFIIKKRFGKDMVDKYKEAVQIGVYSAEQYFSGKNSHAYHNNNINKINYTSQDKKELALDIAKKILMNSGISINTKEEEALLSDMIEAEVYKINNKIK